MSTSILGTWNVWWWSLSSVGKNATLSAITCMTLLPRYDCIFCARSQLHRNCHLVDPKFDSEQVLFGWCLSSGWSENLKKKETWKHCGKLCFCFKSLGGNNFHGDKISWHFPFLVTNPFKLWKESNYLEQWLVSSEEDHPWMISGVQDFAHVHWRTHLKVLTNPLYSPEN